MSNANDQFESLADTAIAATSETRSIDVFIESDVAIRVDNVVVSPQDLPATLRAYDGEDVVFVYRDEYRDYISHETVMDVFGKLRDTNMKYAELKKEDYDIFVSDTSGRRLQAHVLVRRYDYDENGWPRRECKLRIEWTGGNVESNEFSVYHAFASAREKLEPLGLIPLCYGACPEVQVSGMAVDMGDGTIAYRLSSPDQGWHGPTVNIFDSAPDIQPAPVAQQRNFRERRRNTQ